jgi:hypothetical protein
MDTTTADGAVGITLGPDAASITATIMAAAARPHIARRQPAGRRLRYRMVREAAANRTHFSFWVTDAALKYDRLF